MNDDELFAAFGIARTTIEDPGASKTKKLLARAFLHLCIKSENAYKKAIEDSVRLTQERGMSYHSQMEGQGEPEFSNLSFAMGGMSQLALDIAKLLKKKDKKA